VACCTRLPTVYWSLLTDGLVCVAGKELACVVEANNGMNPIDVMHMFVCVYVMALKGE
jgi:hypothetical protein